MIERGIGIKKLRSEDEYNELKQELAKYLEEYRKLIHGNELYEDINSSLDEIAPRQDDGELSEEDKHTAKSLRKKYIAAKSGTYKTMLRRNIASALLSIEEYEASKEDRSPLNVFWGIVTGDKAVREYLNKKYTFFLANFTGDVPGTVNIELESMDEILEYIKESCNLNMNIDLSNDESQEVSTALIPVSDITPENSLLTHVSERVDKFLEEKGITEDAEKSTKHNEMQTLDKNLITERKDMENDMPTIENGPIKQKEDRKKDKNAEKVQTNPGGEKE